MPRFWGRASRCCFLHRGSNLWWYPKKKGGREKMKRQWCFHRGVGAICSANCCGCLFTPTTFGFSFSPSGAAEPRGHVPALTASTLRRSGQCGHSLAANQAGSKGVEMGSQVASLHNPGPSKGAKASSASLDSLCACNRTLDFCMQIMNLGSSGDHGASSYSYRWIMNEDTVEREVLFLTLGCGPNQAPLA